MSEELKPCPFCGGKAAQRKSYDNDGFGTYFSYACKECGASSGERYATETCGIFFESLRDAWNTRSDLAVEVKPLEWEPSEKSDDYWIGKSASGAGNYRAAKTWSGEWKWWHVGDCISHPEKDLQASKAAAQTHHNARVRSELIRHPDDLRPKMQALLSKWEGMTCRTKCAEELREVLEGAG